MTETSKDFSSIQSDYDFFVVQSTEADADLAAHLRALGRAGLRARPVRMVDFGCGPGSFTARFLDGAGWAADELELALVEPVADYRRQALEQLEPRTSRPIAAWDSLPADASGRFDLALSNHAFYYVPDQRESLSQVMRALRPGGSFLAAIAGKDNALVDFWFRAFAILERPVPYHTAEGFEEALRRLGVPYERQDVSYELVFPDTSENRRKILRFLLGEHLDSLPGATALGFFDAYANGDRIEVATRSYQYAVRCPG